LKLEYDLHPGRRVVYSGSAVSGYRKEKESLLGRFLTINVTHLSFKEYLYLKYESYSSIHSTPQEWGKDIVFGEYPEILGMDQNDLKVMYLRDSVLEPLFTVDIDFYGIEKKNEFVNVVRVLADNIGGILNKKNLPRRNIESQISLIGICSHPT